MSIWGIYIMNLFDEQKNMKFINKIIYTLYSYYNSGSTKRIAYENAIITFSFYLCLSTLSILAFFDLEHIIFNQITQNKGHFINWLTAGFIIVPFLLITILSVKKRNIVTIELSAREKFFYKAFLIIMLIIILFALKTFLDPNYRANAFKD
jgi:hypothetical protein